MLSQKEREYVFLEDIAIPSPPSSGIYSGQMWRINTERKLGKFYLRMGLEKPKKIGMDGHYKIPNSVFYIRPVIKYGFTEKDIMIILDHEIKMYDGIFDAWSVPMKKEFIFDSKNIETDVFIFNLDLFSGPIRFKWGDFPKVFDTYINYK